MRNSGKLKALTLGEGIANLDSAVVMQADDIAGNRLFHQHPLSRLEGHCVGDFHILANAHMPHFHTLAVAPGAHPHKGDAITMTRIHVRLDLEHKTTQRVLAGSHMARDRVPALRRWRPLHELVEHFPHPEITQGSAKEHRAQLTRQEGFHVKLVTRATHQFDFIDKIFVLFTQQSPRLRGIQALYAPVIGQYRTLPRGELMEHIGIQVVHPLEFLTHTHRPVDGCALNLQNLLDFVQQLYRVANIAVHFVDEAEDGRIAQTTDIHQLDGAILDTLGTVNHHQRRIDSGQRAIGILGEVLVPRGIQQVHYALSIGKLHHRRGDRDAALLLHAHPVGGGVGAFLAFYAARHLYGITQQQELLGNGGFTRVRMRDNREGATRCDSFAKI